jgi:hypothetical protein
MPLLIYSSDLEERLDRVLSFINRTMPVNRASALVPDAASISGTFAICPGAFGLGPGIPPGAAQA